MHSSNITTFCNLSRIFFRSKCNGSYLFIAGNQLKNLNKFSSISSRYPQQNIKRQFSKLITPKLCPDIEYDELKEKLNKKDIILIDVRTPKEFIEDGFIPGAVNLPLTPLGEALLMSSEDFKNEFNFEKPSQDALLATSCILGIRARTAQLALVGAGYTNVRRFGGSLAGWKENGGPLEFVEKTES